MSFPLDDYTPHGYLDVPAHARNLAPRGVLRSHDIGFRWHVPAYAGMYGGRRETYRAGFRLALDGALELSAFERATSPYHSKDLLTFDVAHGAARLEAAFQAVGEHALHARASAAGRLVVVAEYTRMVSANGEWGESGLIGRALGDVLVLQSFEDGDAFVIWATRPWDDLAVSADLAAVAQSAAAGGPGLPDAGFVTITGRRGDTLTLHAALGFNRASEGLDVFMARGKTADEALERLDAARRAAEGERARKQIDDRAFWEGAPRLEGDWPAHWRRGLVYDLETVRMMVKQPLGIYRHVWDAMQIQAPRVVLAEAAMDALLLGYADPAQAQALLHGTFADAPAPNVPCTREDGSYNMVAADGTVCGTAPQWGYPFLVAAQLYALRPDRAWLERIYPHLSSYLDWWLIHRRDNGGWLHYACSWESGQDDSPRFGPQPLGGGHPVRHVRPVDLQAAFAHAAVVMEHLAGQLGLGPDAAKWRGLAAEFGERTEQLWHGGSELAGGGRYADFDTGAARFTDQDDLMLLAPYALGLAAERAAFGRAAVARIESDQVTWPMFAWTAVEAGLASGAAEEAAALAAAVCERAWGFWDSRSATPDRTLPGVACEYWPPSGRCGGEGYGWGAFTTHLLLRAVLGLRFTPEQLELCPLLPPGWRVAGRRYGVRLRWRDKPLAIVVEPLGPAQVRVRVNTLERELPWGERIDVAWGKL